MEEELQTLQKIIDTASEFAVNYGFQLIGAVFILVIGWFVSRWVGRLVFTLAQKAHVDVTLSKFFASMAKLVVLAFVLIIAMGKFGITIAPFIAALGAVAFGGTLALQGPLSNYGSGLTIILTRPFIVGNTIKVAGVTGKVKDIKLAYTTLVTEDGELITIPNKHIVGEIIHNTFDYLLVDAVVGISYESDADLAISLVRDILDRHKAVPENPDAQVGIKGFADSAVEIAYRYWVPSEQYYRVQYEVNRAVYNSFKQNGITIPFPQHDIHLSHATDQG